MKNLDVIGYDQYCADPSGKIYSLRSGRFLSCVEQRTGYLCVTLSQDGKRDNFSVHRLVALTHLDNSENLPVVNHIDGDKKNNKVTNLEWCTHQENVQHAVDTGLRSGTRNPDRSLTDERAHQVCRLICDNWRNKDISKSLGVSQQIVANIRYGRDYQNIACEYDFTDLLPSRRKLSTDKLIRICELLQEGKPYNFIRKVEGVSTSTISKIKHGKSGIYISKNYKFK